MLFIPSSLSIIQSSICIVSLVMPSVIAKSVSHLPEITDVRFCEVAFGWESLVNRVYQGCIYLVISARCGQGILECGQESLECSTDGGQPFTSTAFQGFLHTWGVKHRRSSVAYPQSNGRAELAVKTAKGIVNGRHTTLAPHSNSHSRYHQTQRKLSWMRWMAIIQYP